MSRLLTIGLFFGCLLAASLQEVTMLLLFSLNRETFAERFCVNKYKPEQNCHGKCYLHQILAKAHADPAPDTAYLSPQQNRGELVYLPPTLLVSRAWTPHSHSGFPLPLSLADLLWAREIFHPPEVWS